MVWRPGISLTTLGGVLACGLPLWPIPYSEVSLPGNPSGATWLVMAALVAGVADRMSQNSARTSILAVTAGFVLAVMGRVTVETARDPTSHNLWPFEVVIAGGIGLVGAAIGVLLVRGVQRIARGAGRPVPPSEPGRFELPPRS